MMNNATIGRKSLMLDRESYSLLSALAKRAGVTRRLIVRAMLDDLDEARVLARAREWRRISLANNAELREKQAALAKVTSHLTAAELTQLLERLASTPLLHSMSASDGDAETIRTGANATDDREA